MNIEKSHQVHIETVDVDASGEIMTLRTQDGIVVRVHHSEFDETLELMIRAADKGRRHRANLHGSATP